VAGGPVGQGGGRVAVPGRAQFLQQLGDGPWVIEAGVAGGSVGGAHGVAWANPAQVGDELMHGVGAAQSDRSCPQGCGVAVQPAVSCGLTEAGQVAGTGCAVGEGVQPR